MANNHTDLGRVQELLDFLQGTVPDGYQIPEHEIPKLTEEQAWCVVWYLAGLYWKVPDHIRRCDVCGELYDTNSSGGHSEDGQIDFCDNCYVETDDAEAEQAGCGE